MPDSCKYVGSIYVYIKNKQLKLSQKKLLCGKITRVIDFKITKLSTKVNGVFNHFWPDMTKNEIQNFTGSLFTVKQPKTNVL